MLRREAMHEIVAATLERGWSDEFAAPRRVSQEPLPGGQEWRLHPELSVYTRPSIDRATRRFVADRHRYTRSRSQVVQRYVRGTLRASAPVQRWRAPPASLWVVPPVPEADGRVVVPGNQRLRVFDTRRGVVRAIRKVGFDDATLRAEVAVRSSARPGPYLAVTAYDLSSGWFEEPLVAGYSLDACPPWRPHRQLLQQTADRLRSWLENTTSLRDVPEHVRDLSVEIQTLAAGLDQVYGSDLSKRSRQLLAGLAPWVDGAGERPFAQTHGDLQHGNVLVGPSGTPTLIDWEYTGSRFREYDGLVHGLHTRRSQGRVERIANYLEHGTLVDDLGLVPRTVPRRERLVSVALLVLEDVLVHLREASSGPFTAVPSSTNDVLADGLRVAQLSPRG